MPSASAKLEKQSSSETSEPLKQILTVVEKKVRNLEKRKAKLDAYKNDSQNGKELNEDQKKAVEKYDMVVEILDFAKDLQKTFTTVIQESTKLQKKAAKRELLERQQQELQRIKEIISIQDILNSMDGETVRNDFLNGTNGAVKLTEEELNNLDELYKLICPERDLESQDSSEFDKQMSVAADHIQALLDSKNKEVIGTTYKAIRETINKIHSSNYFNKSAAATDAEPEIEEVPVVVDPGDIESNNELTDEQIAMLQEDEIKSLPEESVNLQTQHLASGSGDSSHFHNEETNQSYQASRSIQDVLPTQGHLDFLQESQIHLESPPLDTSSMVGNHPSASSGNVGYQSNFAHSPVDQRLSSPHYQQRPKEGTSLTGHMTSSQLLTNQEGVVSTQQPPSGLNFSGTSLQVQNPSGAPPDFDPNRPIPTQTFTNQSFSTAIHPMMAAAGVSVPHSYVPSTLSAMSSHHHVTPQSAAQRVIAAAVSSASSVGSAALTTQSNALSVSSSVQKLSISPQDHKDQFAAASQFIMAQVSRERENSHLGQPPATTATSQFDRVNAHEGFQSVNNSQAYIGRDNFSSDNSSYSGNLKRGLPPRNVPRAGANRGGVASASRGGGNRSAYRN